MRKKQTKKNIVEKNAKFCSLQWLNEFVLTYAIMIVALISFIINFVVLMDYQKSPFSEFLLWDAAIYWKWALEIAGGNWLGNSIFHQTPLYPYLLSFFISIFGENLLPIYIFQCVLGAASSALIYSISLKITNVKWVGLLVGLLYSFYGMQVFYTTKILTECTAILLTVLTVRLLLSNRFLNSTLYSGLSFGFLLLIKPHFLIAAPFLFLHYYIYLHNNGAKSILNGMFWFFIPLTMVVSLVTFRNYYVGKEFVLISSNGGENFYIGNHEKASGTYVPVEGISSDIKFQNSDVIALAQKESGRQLTRSEVSKYWFDKGVAYITNSPSKYIKLEWIKFKDIFSGAELTNMYVMKFEKKNITHSFGLAFVNIYLLFPFFCVGLIAGFRQWKKYFIIFVMLFINILNIMIFFYDSRFLIITMPFFILLSGIGLWNIFLIVSRAKSIVKVFQQPLFIVLIISIGFLSSIYVRDRKFSDQDWHMWMTLGEIYYGLDKLDMSLEMFVKSSGLNKGNCMPVFGVCKTLYKQGNKDLAIQIFNSTYQKIGPDDKKTIMRDGDFDSLREYSLQKTDRISMDK